MSVTQLALLEDERPDRPNGPVEGAAWQKQLRDLYLSEGTPDVPHLDLKRAVVRPVSKTTAARVIFKYEWLGTMAKGSRWHFGIFFGERCAGVTCIADSTGIASTGTAGLFGVGRSELGVLARGACVHWAPPGTNSKLVAWTGRLLARTSALKLLIAYSDPEAGEIGTIYQACNWAYIGTTQAKFRLVSPDGLVRDERRIDDWAKRDGVSWSQKLDEVLAAGWRKDRGQPKGRYVYILDRADRALAARIESMRRPYPKRTCVASIVADAPGDQPGEGGSTPTATLHEATA